ncbi:hypothetical protein DW954_02385 [Clostridium sp. AM45-5]|jgi:hypothetical protein|nr:hypothetical protein [Clostridium sp. AM45-5]RHS68205.1 hypothetical protein DW954_02385 [Clostridium sp. AM45-5]
MSKYEMSVACLLGGLRYFVVEADSAEEAKRKTMMEPWILRNHNLLNLSSLRVVKKIREPVDSVVRQKEMW